MIYASADVSYTKPEKYRGGMVQRATFPPLKQKNPNNSFSLSKLKKGTERRKYFQWGFMQNSFRLLED